jgi:histidinol-phosphate phosphatase family protein
MKNQLIILCGGKGTRLGQLTKKTAKPMLKINGQPFLNYLLRSICILPLDEIILIAGFNGQDIHSIYDNTIVNGVKIKVIIESNPSGTLGALRFCKEHLEDVFWVANGDTFFSLKNLKKWSNEFSADVPKDRLMISTYVDDSKRYGRLEVNSNSILKDFLEKDEYGKGGLINAGLVRIHRSDINLCTSPYNTSLESDLFVKLISDQKIRVLQDVIENFIDYGIPSAFGNLPKVLEKYFSNKVCFWDRDGTLNTDDGYTYKIEDYKPTNVTNSARGIFSDLKVKNFIVTNQSGIARGLYGIPDLLAFHKHMKYEFMINNRRIDDFIFCPHHPDGILPNISVECNCRKPKTGMFDELINNWNLSIEDCKFIGDSETDKQAAETLGLNFFKFDDCKTKVNELEVFCNVN